LTSCCPKGWRPVRRLSPEEAALWARVTATIQPLSRERKSSSGGGGEPPKAVEVAQSPARRPLRQPRYAGLPPPRAGEDLHRNRTLDASWDRRLRSGTVEPDRILDLHGMTLDGA